MTKLKRLIIQSVGEDMESTGSLICWMECKLVKPLLAVFTKAEYTQNLWSSNFHFLVYIQNKCIYTSKDLYKQKNVHSIRIYNSSMMKKIAY